jgi:hypothetical protein
MNPLSLINPSSEIVYYSTTFSNHVIIFLRINHVIIRLVRFVSKIKVGIMEWILSLICI